MAAQKMQWICWHVIFSMGRLSEMGINRWHCAVGSCVRQLLFVRFDRRIADGEPATENFKGVMELAMGRLDCSRSHLCVCSCRCGALNWDNPVGAFFNAGGLNDVGNRHVDPDIWLWAC